MRTVKQDGLLIRDEVIITDWTLWIMPCHCLLFDFWPESIKGHFLLLSLERILLTDIFLIHKSLNIRIEAFQKLFGILYILVDCLDHETSLLPLFLDQAWLAFRDKTKFESNESLTHIFTVWFIVLVFHSLIEWVSGKEASGQSLDFDDHGNQIPFLPFYERFWIIIRMSAYWTRFLNFSFRFHEPLETFQARLVIHMRATQNTLLIKLQVFETNWAWLMVLGSF